jgi:hypothetical protein
MSAENYNKKDFVRDYILSSNGPDNIDYNKMAQEIMEKSNWGSKSVQNVINYLKKYVYQVMREKDESPYEDQFRKKVVQYLETEKKHSVEEGNKYECGGQNQEIDICSKKGKEVYFNEVKTGVDKHRLQTGIGQLIFHQFGVDFREKYNSTKYHYQLVFPKTVKVDQHFYYGFIDYIKEKCNIDIIFI